MSTKSRAAFQRWLLSLPSVVAATIISLLVRLTYPERSGFVGHDSFRYFAAASSISSLFSSKPRIVILANVALLGGLLLVHYAFLWQSALFFVVLALLCAASLIKTYDFALTPIFVLGWHYAFGMLFCYIFWEVTEVVNEQDNIILCYFEAVFPSLAITLFGVWTQNMGVFIAEVFYMCLLGLKNTDVYVAVQGTSCLLVIIGVYVFHQVYVKSL